jgi:hypothetical protein
MGLGKAFGSYFSIDKQKSRLTTAFCFAGSAPVTNGEISSEISG